MIMRTTYISAAVVALGLAAGAASAQSVNPGLEQLAALAGVNAAGYTQADLVNLIDAQRSNDQEKAAFITATASGVASRAETAGYVGLSQGDVQLAKLAGVEPGVYSASELNRLIAAKNANDPQTVAFILNHTDRVDAGGLGTVSQGKAQLAAQLGVNPADYTLAQLSALLPQADD
jgi:hypothetical protein